MQQRSTVRVTVAAVLLSAMIIAVPVGQGSTAEAASGPPIGNIGKFKQRVVENFSTKAPAANGKFAKTYAKNWQPYPDGTGGMYYSGTQISAHDGVMDVLLDGKKGAAGTFGTAKDAWTHVGGKFTVRARAVGGDGNGAAFMLWPNSNRWADGEIDYPEGNFEASPMVFQHSMIPGNEVNTTEHWTGVSWRAWHTYSIEWIPGKSVTYQLDGKVIKTITKDVPTTGHRYMFQVGDWGKWGHLHIDWFTTYDYVK